GTRSLFVYPPPAYEKTSKNTARASKNQSKPAGFPVGATSTHIKVVHGRNMIPSTGQTQEPSNARSHRFGSKIHQSTSAARALNKSIIATRHMLVPPLS